MGDWWNAVRGLDERRVLAIRLGPMSGVLLNADHRSGEDCLALCASRPRLQPKESSLGSL